MIAIRYIGLLILAVCISCNSKEVRAEYLNHLQEIGYRFYAEFDPFTLEPKHEVQIDAHNRGWPAFAVHVEGDKLSLIEMDSLGNLKHRNYHKINNYYVSTTIVTENEALFFREVLIIIAGTQIFYKYTIDQNREYLASIEIRYRNGGKKYFENKDRSFYDFIIGLDESTLTDVYPSFFEVVN